MFAFYEDLNSKAKESSSDDDDDEEEDEEEDDEEEDDFNLHFRFGRERLTLFLWRIFHNLFGCRLDVNSFFRWNRRKSGRCHRISYTSQLVIVDTGSEDKRQKEQGTGQEYRPCMSFLSEC